MTMRSLVGGLFFLLVQGQWCQDCAVNDEQRPLVTHLVNKMIQSTIIPDAVPSVLLALRLVGDHSLSTELKLLQRLAQDAVDKVQNGKPFSSGQVALHALAHRAACSDPRQVSADGVTIDLVQLLENKFKMELENIEIYGNPLTNYYQLGFCVISLCQLQGSLSPSETAELFTPGPKKYNLGHHFSVDTAAVSVLAQICLQTSDNSLAPEVNKTLTANIEWLLKKILEQKRKDEVIGNLYSTGEAMQALCVSDKYLIAESWSFPKTLARVLSEIPKGTFDSPPIAAAQILPSLEGQTYLDVNTITCSEDKDNLTFPTVIPPTTNHHRSNHLITVVYTVTDSVSNTFTDSTTVSVPKGSVFLRVMEVAQKKEPKRFRFTFEQTAWGPYITSVRGLKEDSNKRTYWQLLSGTTPLSKGAGEYVVSDGESLVVKFNTY